MRQTVPQTLQPGRERDDLPLPYHILCANDLPCSQPGRTASVSPRQQVSHTPAVRGINKPEELWYRARWANTLQLPQALLPTIPSCDATPRVGGTMGTLGGIYGGSGVTGSETGNFITEQQRIYKDRQVSGSSEQCRARFTGSAQGIYRACGTRKLGIYGIGLWGQGRGVLWRIFDLLPVLMQNQSPCAVPGRNAGPVSATWSCCIPWSHRGTAQALAG